MANILLRLERRFFIHPSAQASIRPPNPSYFTYRGIGWADGLPWSRATRSYDAGSRFGASLLLQRREAGGRGGRGQLARPATDAASRTIAGATAGDPSRRACQERIAEAVQAADYPLVVVAEHSLGSGWVTRRAEQVREGGLRWPGMRCTADPGQAWFRAAP